MKFIIIILLFVFSLYAEVGKVTFMKGDVFVLRDGQSKPTTVGMELQEKDAISTKKSSLVKLIFSDKSAISIGSNSEFSIEKYFFDEKKESVANFKMKKGIFRAITGKMAKLSPDKFKLKTRTVTIGIRGTIFSGVIEKEREEFFCEKGTIYVSSKGVSLDVAKGYKTQVMPGKRPTPPQRFKASELNKIRTQTTGFKNKKCETKP